MLYFFFFHIILSLHVNFVIYLCVGLANMFFPEANEIDAGWPIQIICHLFLFFSYSQRILFLECVEEVTARIHWKYK